MSSSQILIHVSRLVILWMVVTVTPECGAQSAGLERYPLLRAHEAKPGILIVVRSRTNTRLCEVSIQKDQFAGGVARLGSIDEKDLEEVLQQIAPLSDRGRSLRSKPVDRLGELNGSVLALKEDFEKVTIFRYMRICKACERGTALAVIRWREPSCEETSK